MKDSLTPQAQAVKDAAYTLALGAGLSTRVAAALVAAADQAEQKWPGFSHEACQEIRAIAAELEATHD